MTEVVVVNSPSGSVVTIITPESVSELPSSLVVVQVEVKVVKGGGITEVVVVKEPSESVVTMTTPESVDALPSESVVVHVDVKVVRVGPS
ncbi:hypothetical protein QG37_06623 [Candidozyma auris]|nr:hypothetical protein QG37_06623 [[Candida] auris]